MGNKNKTKSKKKENVGGLQPKGGAYAGQDAEVMATDPMVANAMLKQKAKEDKIKQKEKDRKDKEKAKGEKKERRGLFKRLKETGGELKKVRWPAFRHALKQTGVVLGVVVLFGVIVFGIDRGLSWLYNLLIDKVGG